MEILVKNAIKESALKHSTSKNSLLKNTKNIVFKVLKTSEYILDNRNSSLTKIIFSLRSKTFDIKNWQPWKYHDNLCVTCEIKEETINHFFLARHMKIHLRKQLDRCEKNFHRKTV
jgi:hypothetical protein